MTGVGSSTKRSDHKIEGLSASEHLPNMVRAAALMNERIPNTRTLETAGAARGGVQRLA